MRLVLRSKSGYTSAEVAEVFANIESYVSKTEAERAVQVAAEELTEIVGRRKAAIAWSGGKDSLALETVMRATNLPLDGCLGVASALEVPEALRWFRTHRPDGIVEYDRPFDLEWLKANPQFLFPLSGDTAQVFTTRVTRWSQHSYINDYNPDVMLVGRRRADGNWFDPKDPLGRSQAHGVEWYSPIRDWPHEVVLAVMHYFHDSVPPTYSWSRGWETGTGPWPGWRMTDGWEYLAEVDPILAARVREELGA